MKEKEGFSVNVAFIHPVIQAGATLAVLYVFYLGISRFRSLHLGHKVPFARQMHVNLGRAALIVMTLGTVGGLVYVRWAWHGWLVTGPHGRLGLAALPLVLFGLVSGWYMAASPRPRKGLPLVHGLVNTAVAVIALVQFYLGKGVIDTFIKGL